MKFLRTLLWVVITALVAMLAVRNWRDVTILLWGDLQADVKIPVLMLIMFLLGLVPAWLVYRARYWRRVRSTAATPARTAARDEDREEAAA